MRPIELTMTAFGSFARKTTVRFSDFQSGLFLIVGETGAGKTTVFDAIVFALYGAASGTRRKPEMMHSDYAEKSTDTAVTLVFEQGGRAYTVTRTIHFKKTRGAADVYTPAPPKAVLLQPDGSAVEGGTAVTRRCEELLGLNADQFRKIVMLAQGEFRQFLSADAAKKSEILGRLFDSSAYVRYQNLLSLSRSLLEKRRRACQDTVSTVMDTVFQAPEGAGDYLPGDPRLIEKLDALIADDTQRSAALTAQKAAAQERLNEVNTRKGAAEVNNRTLDELLALRERGQRLEARRGAMEASASRHALAERAWRRVVPVRQAWQAALDALRRAGGDIDALRGQVAALTERRDAAQTVADGDEAAKRRVLDIHAAEQSIADSLPQYDRLSALRDAVARQSDAAGALRRRLADTETRRRDGAERLALWQEELTALEDAEAASVRAEAQYADARADADAFNGAGGIAESAAAIRADEALLRRDADALAERTREAMEAAADYHRAYQAFIGGQAGLLAAELRQALAERGSAPCPVCGVVAHSGQEHAFAPLVAGTPTQARVDAAKRRAEGCERERGELYSRVERQRSALAARRDALLARTQALTDDCADWARLADEAWLTAAAERFRHAEAEAKRLCAAAAERVNRRTALKRQSEALNETLNALTRDTEQQQESLAALETAVAARTAEARTLADALPFADRSDAEARLLALGRDRAALKRRIDADQAALDAAREALDRARGALRSKEAALPEQEAAEAAARGAFETALRANGFADPAALDAALAPMDGGDPERWLAEQREAVSAYRNDCANTAQRIAELAERSSALRYTDLEALKKELGEAGEALDAAEDACAAQTARLRNHAEVRRRIADALGELQRTRGAWERLDRLAELAVGSSGDGGRLSFERYVMGSIFREVLDMANRRLDVMSGGRYVLVHTVGAARSNAAAGLEIEVLDAATGRQRPADSLSGGEAFQVSLSLALGLSDVVQSHAGGIRLDTVFIDEGFGSLGSGALDNAITVLNQLSEGSRLVGVISHVDKLAESIPQKLRVRKTAHGSEVVSELS